MSSTPRSLTIVSLSVVALLATACGNDATAEVVGAAGVTVDRDGRPAAIVMTCEGTVDLIEIVGGRGGLAEDEPNPTVASWTAPAPQSGTIVLDLAKPASPWTGDPVGTLVDDDLYVVAASRSDKDAEVTQASFRGSDLDSLDADHVIVRDGTVLTRSQFETESCEG